MQKFHKLTKFTIRSILILIILCFCIFVSLYSNYVQNKLTGFIASQIYTETGIKINFKSVKYQLFNKFSLSGVYILDLQKDTVIKIDNLTMATDDWFFLKNNINIHYFVADGLKLNINEFNKDSTNIDFLLKAFNSKSKNSNSSQNMIGLQKLELRNLQIVHYKKNDFKNSYRLNKININFKDFNNQMEKIDINDCIVDKFDATLVNIPSENHIKKTFDINDLLNFKTTIKIPFKLNINKLAISNININEVKNINNDLIKTNILNKFSLQLNSFSLDSSKIQSQIVSKGDYKKLNFEHIIVNFVYQKNRLTLHNLNLKTKRSFINSNFIINPKTQIHTNEYKVKHLQFIANFSPSIINGEDLKYIFGNQMNTPLQTIQFKGSLSGDIDSLNFNNIHFSIGKITTFAGSLKVYNFLDTNTIKIVGNIYNLSTDVSDIKNIFPKTKTYNLNIGDSIGKFTYQGKINYARNNLTTEGNIQSLYGNILHNLNFQFLPNNSAIYKGNISTTHLNLNKWLNVNQFGLVDFNGNINGSGLSYNSLNMSINGKFSNFTFNAYNYQNLILNGNFENKSFTGNLSIDDINLKLNSFVKINLFENSYSLKGRLDDINTKEILQFNNGIYGQSDFDINFIGNSFDDMLGTISLSNIHLQNEDYKYFINTFSFTISKPQNNILNYSIESDILNGFLKCNIPLRKLFLSKNQFIQKYLPNLAGLAIDTSILDPELTFDFKVINLTPVIKLFNNSISGLNFASLKGEYSNNKPLNINMILPNFKYNNLDFVQSVYHIYDSQDQLFSNLSIEKIKLNDTTILNTVLLNSKTYHDTNYFGLKIGSKKIGLYLDFNTLLTINKENIWTIKQNPSILKIYNNLWNFDPNGVITYKNPVIYTHNISLENGIQKINLTNGSNFNRKFSDLNLNFNNVSITEFTSIFLPKIKASGIIDGNIIFNKFINNFTSEATINLHNFKLQNDSLGLISLFVRYDSSKKILYEIVSNNFNYNFNLNGIYNTKNIHSPLEATKINFEGISVHVLYPLFKDFFSSISGKSYGYLNINGSLEKPEIDGQLKVFNGEIGVSFNKVNYFFDTALFYFNPEIIIIKPALIKDKFGNKGEVFGTLNHKYFKNFSYNINILSDNILVLNTPQKSNDNFYGTVFAKIKFLLSGNDDNLNFDIDATTGNNTKFFIQNIDEKEFVEETFIKFKTKALKTKAQNNYYFKTNYSYNLNLKVLNNSEISVILDNVANDVISGAGHGDLSITGSTSNPVSIRGIYNIDKGKYDINFQSLLRTTFEILPNGNNFIEWTDKPLEAYINIEAVYKTQPVSITDLVGNSQFSSNIKSYKGPVYIVAVMKDRLNNPKISFRLDFAPDAPILTNNDFNVFLKQLEQNENEILKQVGFLILFQSFAPIGNIAGNFNSVNYNYSSIGYNTLSKIISNQLNTLLNNLLSKVSKDKSFSFDFGTSFYNSLNLINQSTGSNNLSTGLLVDRNLINFKVSKSFFKDKLILSINPGIDFNLGSTTYETTKFAFLPNVNAEVDLTKDKKLKLIIFTNSSLDYTGIQFGRRNRQGIRFTYQKDFN